MEQGYSKKENRILGFISLLQSILYFTVICSIHEADSLLYRAKDRGRNQVILDEKIKYVN